MLPIIGFSVLSFLCFSTALYQVLAPRGPKDLMPRQHPTPKIFVKPEAEDGTESIDA